MHVIFVSERVELENVERPLIRCAPTVVLETKKGLGSPKFSFVGRGLREIKVPMKMDFHLKVPHLRERPVENQALHL